MKQKARVKKSMGATIWEWVRTVALALAAALLLRTFVFSLIHVEGESMCNTLQNKDILFVTMFDHYTGGDYARGEIVICNYPNAKGYRVKRVVGLPGETFEIRGGTVYINGEELCEEYLGSEKNQDYAPITLGADEYFLLGDNRAYSRDSRSSEVGAIAEGEIRGVARAVIFPFGNIKALH